MGQMVYVLMSLEGSGKNKSWRPVAVVSNPDLANQWYEYGQGVDWVPLELDNIDNISPENLPRFQPRKTTPGEQKAVELSQKMEATIDRMQKIIDDQTALIKKLQKGQKRSKYQSPLLKEADRTILPQETVKQTPGAYGYETMKTQPIAEDPHMKAVPSWVTGAAEKGDSIPPKPVEKIKGGSQPFPEKLDAQGLADYIETYATYPVDNEMVYEKFRGAHAVLKLMPIADLREGGRDHNQQSKSNEAKYLKQSLKTQPPAVVENGEVLDGNHRLRANKRRGLTHMWCYVVMEGD